VHLVGSIIRIYHAERSSESQKTNGEDCQLQQQFRQNFIVERARVTCFNFNKSHHREEIKTHRREYLVNNRFCNTKIVEMAWELKSKHNAEVYFQDILQIIFGRQYTRPFCVFRQIVCAYLNEIQALATCLSACELL